MDRINPRFWFDANYLLYFLSPSRYPQPFLTTSPTASLGILGQNGTHEKLTAQWIDRPLRRLRMRAAA